MKVGFIGVGNMGNPMATNLVKAGHELTVHDLRRESATNLLEMESNPQAGVLEAPRRTHRLHAYKCGS